MKKVSLVSVLSIFMVLGFAALAMAAEGNALQGGHTIGLVMAATLLFVVVGVGIAAAGCGIGMGMCSKACLESVARNPEMAGKLTVNMFIGLALIEALTIYALVVALIVIYANPLVAKLLTVLGVS